jgi:hypothetical protein
MSLTSYRAAPSRAGLFLALLYCFRMRDIEDLSRSGSDLLSHTLRCSTIGAAALNCRVRNGAGCFARAMTTRPRKILILSKSVHFGVCSIQYVYLLLDQIKPIGQLVPVN